MTCSSDLMSAGDPSVSTFLIVEHDMDLIMKNCERVIVMHQGSVLMEGTPADVKSNERVLEAYLGGEVET